MGKKSFWDFCAPLYDFFEKVNGRAYAGMLNVVRELVSPGATVLEAAAGTGAISLAIADKAKCVLCTDISESMLRRARHKLLRNGVKNVSTANKSIYALGQADASFDIVVAGQVLHLLDEPPKAAAELRRVAKKMVILPMSVTKNLHGLAKINISLYRLVGFAPKVEFDAAGYKAFLSAIGFDKCSYVAIEGRIPMVVAIWKQDRKEPQ